MIIAVLFNSDHHKYGGYYGPPIRDMILGSHVLQNSNRHLKVAIGDVLILAHSHNHNQYARLAESTFFSHPWMLLKEDQLRATYSKATIYAWLIQNTTDTIAIELDNALRGDDAYLGMHGVDYSIPSHLALYRNSMVPYCRLRGTDCNLFYSMGSEDEQDKYLAEELNETGFINITWEDRGAHQTIFDDFDTLEHFRQIRQVQSIFASVLPGGDFEAEELVMMLEDLNPRLFDVLGSAVNTLSHATNTEDLAQVGLSGRRYIEQLADVLFPSRDTPVNGREVTQNKFKNRLWAFIESYAPGEGTSKVAMIQQLGKEVDRLVDEANAAVHGGPSREKVLATLGDLAKLTVALLQLDPEVVRKPYFAFQRRIEEFVNDVLSRRRP